MTVAWTLAALPLTAVALATEATGVNQHLQQAKSFYEELRYQESYTEFEKALLARENRPHDFVDIYLHLGILSASMDRQEEARGHFGRLLCVNAEAKLPPGLPPKIQRPFAKAQEESAEIKSFRLIHSTLNQLPAVGGMDIEAELQPDDLGLATGLTLRYRPVGAADFYAQRREGRGKFAFSVSASELPAGTDGEYFVEINNQYGGVLWEFGSAKSPIVAAAAVAQTTVAVAAVEPEPEPFYEQTWFWLTAGGSAAVLVAAGTVAVVVAMSQSQEKSADFGEVETEVRD